MSEMRVSLPFEGGCQCGAIRYCVNAIPLTLYCCHCTECQAQSSSAFGMSMLVSGDSLEVDWDATKAWSRPTHSGNVIDCHFCPGCGSRLFHVDRSGDSAEIGVVSIKAGSLDDHSWLRPIGHLWTNSKQPWFEVPPEMLSSKRDPGDLEPYFSRWREVSASWFGPLA
ncbi:MAG: GFA family protein [Rhodospirillaceae bacterium]|jgi:hypothetical protein|nr:GFA family protein [Rhodospirillaceae bacterium]MBT6203999.1 GFA family protein [Rhodospirillaceae bacterium]MBT6511281.1 GFA family protein [Rhodospirillaceae bacterium]MBT7612662.1 GFA family protein [Rhodospirillaceae bacterium]